MKKHLVFVGGGHAHLASLKNLRDFTKQGHEVTLISPSAYHYYSGMGPGMLSGIYRPWEVRFHLKKLVEDQGATFIRDKVVGISPKEHLLFLQSKREVHYDIASFNVGSDVAVERIIQRPQEKVFPVKPVVNLLEARLTILERLREGKPFHFAVIGGGPAGVEISANLWRVLDENKGKGRIVLIGGKRLLEQAPEKVRRLALQSLAQRGVQVMEGCHVKEVEDQTVILADGKRIDFDFAFAAVGIRPPSLFRESGLPTGEDGGLLVNASLQSVVHPDLFGGGDCISLEGYSLAKVGVYAVRQNAILYRNLLAALGGGSMVPFKPQEYFLLILNMGNGQGLLWKKNWVWQSRFAFILKDYIDRRFMKRFQISGERKEKRDLAE